MDFVFVCETWLTEEISTPVHFQQRGFSSVQSCGSKPTAQGRPSGGLMCLYNRNFYELDNILLNKNFIMLRIVKLNLIIVFVYLNFEFNFCDLLHEVSERVSKLLNKFGNAKVIYCGDFDARVGNLNCLADTNDEALELSLF